MVLPPYVYKGDWREMKTHISAVFRATSLPCMLYNNPIAYGTDFLPEQISELAAEHENFEAVKESSTDARRVSAIRALVDRRLEISVGVDDAILEAIGVGATGWVAGLANAFPRESVDLLNLGIQGESDKAFELYRWFLPLLRMDTVYNFVQLIKLVQAEVGMGNSRVRPPRLELIGRELEAAATNYSGRAAHTPATGGRLSITECKSTLEMAHDSCDRVTELMISDHAGAVAHTSLAVSATSRNFAFWSAAVTRFPSIVEAKPHCGLRASLSIEM